MTGGLEAMINASIEKTINRFIAQAFCLLLQVLSPRQPSRACHTTVQTPPL